MQMLSDDHRHPAGHPIGMATQAGGKRWNFNTAYYYFDYYFEIIYHIIEFYIWPLAAACRPGRGRGCQRVGRVGLRS